MDLEAKQRSSCVFVRPYKPSDQAEILELLVKGTTEGATSPLTLAIGYFRPYVWGSGLLAILAIALTIVRSSTNSTTAVTSLCHSSVAADAVLLSLYVAAIGLFLYGRLGERSVEGLATSYISACTEDLVDVISAFGLEACSSTPYYAPSGPSGFWVAERDGKVVGYVGLKVSKKCLIPKVGDVCRLLVAENQRGQGIGTMLMNTLFFHARRHGLEALELMTSTTYNKPACILYERHGFVKSGDAVFAGHKLTSFRKIL